MKILNTCAILVVFLAVACVGMHLYIVEGELNDVRQTASQQGEQNDALVSANNAIVFASETQYIAVMAEERAYEMAAKLDIASLIVAALEEQLEQATSVVESQCVQLRDLIDLNSELQMNAAWQEDEMDRVLEEQIVLEDELIDALRVAEDRRVSLEAAKARVVFLETALAMRDTQLQQADAQIELLTVQLTAALLEIDNLFRPTPSTLD